MLRCSLDGWRAAVRSALVTDRMSRAALLYHGITRSPTRIPSLAKGVLCFADLGRRRARNTIARLGSP